jgi:hypothetical protein
LATAPRSGLFGSALPLVVEPAAQHGSAGEFFANCPDSDYVNFLRLLKEKGSYLSGDAGQRFLRAIGKPAFITTKMWSQR